MSNWTLSFNYHSDNLPHAGSCRHFPELNGTLDTPGLSEIPPCHAPSITTSFSRARVLRSRTSVPLYQFSHIPSIPWGRFLYEA